MEAGALKPNLLGFVRPAWSTSVSIGLVWSGRSNPLPDVSRPWLGFRQRGSPSPETYKKTKDDRWHGYSFKQIKAVGWSQILSMRTRGPPRVSPRLFGGGFFVCLLFVKPKSGMAVRWSGLRKLVKTGKEGFLFLQAAYLCCDLLMATPWFHSQVQAVYVGSCCMDPWSCKCGPIVTSPSCC